MSSWRDGVSEETQNDFDNLFDEGLKVAEHFLSKSKEYYPFGIVVTKAGEIAHRMTYDGNEHPESNEVIADLQKTYTMTKNEIRAALIVYDVRISTGDDAICFSLEHEHGVAIQIIVPYTFKGFLKKTLVLKMESAGTSLKDKTIWA